MWAMAGKKDGPKVDARTSRIGLEEVISEHRMQGRISKGGLC